jgi:hypothetical protein
MTRPPAAPQGPTHEICAVDKNRIVECCNQRIDAFSVHDKADPVLKGLRADTMYKVTLIRWTPTCGFLKERKRLNGNRKRTEEPAEKKVGMASSKNEMTRRHCSAENFTGNYSVSTVHPSVVVQTLARRVLKPAFNPRPVVRVQKSTLCSEIPLIRT